MYRSQETNNQKDGLGPNPSILRFFFLATLFAGIAPVGLAQYNMGNRADGGNASIQVSIVNENGSPIDLPAHITLSPEDSTAGIQQIGADDGRGRFLHVSGGEYTVSVTIPGFKDGTTDVDVMDSGMVEASVTMSPANDSATSAGAYGIVLAPKAKKDLDQGVSALHASQFDQAQQDFEAAYKLAPGDPDVNDALGVLFLVKNDFNQAEEYMQRALSLDPQNVNALVNMGQLRLMQHDAERAEITLQRAIALGPRNTLAHWLLGAAYLDSGQFEKARVEAIAAIKTGKETATDAQFILGEALAGLGRSDEAIAALQTFVHQLPNDSYAPEAQALIAKLQAAPAVLATGLATHNAAVPDTGAAH